MRLTLRTLLAYLDDTLEPAQAKIIGQKVAESEQARELMDHIKQVTRRRRLTTPPTSGPGGKIDPNTIAEYLDGAVSAEQASEVEQVCLASDVHLAEVAACHQILALVLGEPALVPPTAKSRMYALVKGPESIPFRRPTNPQADAQRETLAVGEDTDETLRMGLPFLGERRKWTSFILLIATGIGAAALLLMAIWHVLNLGIDDQNRKPGTEIVQDLPNGAGKVQPIKQPIDSNNKGSKDSKNELPKPTEVKKDPPKDFPKDPPNGKKPGNDDWNLPPPDFSKLTPPTDKAVLPVGGDIMPENRFTVPDNHRLVLGTYQAPSSNYPSLVAWRPYDKSLWTRLLGSKAKVESGCTYAALPGFQGDLRLDHGVLLTLAGNIPEIMPALLSESVIDLHVHDSRVDLTLQRGRVVLTSLKDTPVAVRLRFESAPPQKQDEFVDILLKDKGSQVFVDRIGIGFPPGPFTRDRESPQRIAPNFFVFFWVAKGSALMRSGDVVHALTSPPGQAVLKWSNIDGKKVEIEKWDKLPDSVTLTPTPQKIPDMNQQKFNDDIINSRETLSNVMGTKGIDVGLRENLDTKDLGRRIMVVRSYAALGFLTDLIEILTDERKADIHIAAIQGLQSWMKSGRDHEFAVFDGFNARFAMATSKTAAEKEADKAMELLHGIFPDPYLLVDYLDNSNIIIRQLSHINLCMMVAEGRAIPYVAAMPTELRMKAQKAWRELLNKVKEEAQKKKGA